MLIIGAGISGLAASKTLLENDNVQKQEMKEGKQRYLPSVILLEADPNRVGGRLHSIPLGGKGRTGEQMTKHQSLDDRIDLGGASLHGSETKLGQWLLQQEQIQKIKRQEGEEEECIKVDHPVVNTTPKKKNVLLNEPQLSTIPWGSSIYPGQSAAQWWHFFHGNQQTDNSTRGNSATMKKTIAAGKDDATSVVLLDHHAMKAAHNHTIRLRGQIGACINILRQKRQRGEKQQHKHQHLDDSSLTPDQQEHEESEEWRNFLSLDDGTDGTSFFGKCIHSSTSSKTSMDTSATTEAPIPSTNDVAEIAAKVRPDDEGQVELDGGARCCLEQGLAKLQQLIESCNGSSDIENNNNGSITMKMIEFQLFMENELDRGINIHDLDLNGFVNDWDYEEVSGEDIALVHGMQSLPEYLSNGLERYYRIGDNNDDDGNCHHDKNNEMCEQGRGDGIQQEENASLDGSGSHVDSDDVLKSGEIHFGQRVTRIEYSTTKTTRKTRNDDDAQADTDNVVDADDFGSMGAAGVFPSDQEHACQVTTESGQVYVASLGCIVTLPLGVLKENSESMFRPPLPNDKTKALERSGMSTLNTLVIQWKYPICRSFSSPPTPSSSSSSSLVGKEMNHPTAHYMIDSPLQYRNNDKDDSDDERSILAHGFVCPKIVKKQQQQEQQEQISEDDDSNVSTSSNRTVTITAEDEKVTQFYFIETHHPRTGKVLDFQNMTYWNVEALKVMNLFLRQRQRQHQQRQQQEEAEKEQCNFDQRDENLSSLEEDDIEWSTVSSWHLNRNSLGSYSAPIHGTKGNMDRRILQYPLYGTLYFAGEHTNTNGRYQTIDGAYDTGVLAAEQMLSTYHFSISS